jgi:hypothetical protein
MKFVLTLLTLSPLATLAAEVSFNRDIRPLLSDNCYYCHGFDEKHREAGLRLDVRESALKDNDGVRAIVPGDPDKSELWLRIISEDEDEVMPPPKAHRKPFTSEQKELIKRWIEQGAKYEAHWAFVPPRKVAAALAAPGTEGSAKAEATLSAIDHYIGHKLKAEGLALSPQSEPGSLLRRLTLDLTGMPPTIAELEAFEKAAAKDFEKAYATAIDRLLKSPRYGERMAMDWLDAARYADTNGYQMDSIRMNWPWRDWVVRAFNDNMRFDRFTIEQLAGDMLPKPSQDQLVATAFNRNHMLNAEGGTIAEENRTKTVFDRVETTSTVWLGLTMGCSQCHDHKFDPITQKDYYSMFALFNQLVETGGVDKRFGKKSYSNMYDSLYAMESPYLMLATPEQEAQMKSVQSKRDSAEKALMARSAEFKVPFETWVKEVRADGELLVKRIEEDGLRRIAGTIKLETLNYEKLTNKTERALVELFLRGETRWASAMKAIDVLRTEEEKIQQQIPHVMIMRDEKKRDTRVLNRGNYETPGEKVEPAVPSFLPKLPAGTKADRLALANWLVSAEHPLMSRVTVNRLWQQFFGRGIVKTPDDFGLQGALPSHPELLDWLAVEFRESGWDVQHMIRLIVGSKTYRQSAVVTPAMLAKDPENVLLARGPRHRLDSRFLRDHALALSGLLVEKRGGPAVMPYQPPGIWEEMSFGKNRYFQGTDEDLYRRSLYTFWRRSVAPASFFDVPARQSCAVKPQRTSTPLHALTMLNDITYVEAARVWAEKLASIGDETLRLQNAYRSATGRSLDDRGLRTLTQTLTQARQHYQANAKAAEQLITTGESKRVRKLLAAEHAAWTTVCLMILNLDETLNP